MEENVSGCFFSEHSVLDTKDTPQPCLKAVACHID